MELVKARSQSHVYESRKGSHPWKTMKLVVYNKFSSSFMLGFMLRNYNRMNYLVIIFFAKPTKLLQLACKLVSEPIGATRVYPS